MGNHASNHSKIDNNKGSVSINPAKFSVQRDDEDRDQWKEYALKKRRPGCNGMFWRSDPTGNQMLTSNSNWPKDGAMLRGVVVEAKGQKWLLAKEVLQKGSRHWMPAPVGAAIPFEYNNHYYLDN